MCPQSLPTVVKQLSTSFCTLMMILFSKFTTRNDDQKFVEQELRSYAFLEMNAKRIQGKEILNMPILLFLYTLKISYSVPP